MAFPLIIPGSLGPFERQLYDIDYLNSNCTLAIDKNSNIDDLKWTGITNFIIFGTTLLSSLLLWYKSDKKRADRYMPGIFFVVSLSYGLVPGIIRQIFHGVDYGIPGSILIRLVLVLLEIAHAMLMFVGIRSLTSNLAARDAWLVLNLIVLILALLKVSAVVLLYGLVVVVFILGIYMYQAIKNDGRVWVKVLAVVVLLFGYVIQVVLAKTCGDAAYENCFRDCPLPNPSVFNHNALQLLIFAVGFGLLAVGEVLVPASSLFISGSDMGKRGRVVDRVVVNEGGNGDTNSDPETPAQEETFDDTK